MEEVGKKKAPSAPPSAPFSVSQPPKGDFQDLAMGPGCRFGGGAGGGPGALAGGGAPLLGTGGIGGSSLLAPRASRARRDIFWAVAYCALLAGAVIGGICATANRDATKLMLTIQPGYMNDPAHCPLPHESSSAEGARRRLLGALADATAAPAPGAAPSSSSSSSSSAPGDLPPTMTQDFISAMEPLTRVAWIYISGSVLGGLVLGVAAIALFKAKPAAAVAMAVFLTVAAPLAGGIAVVCLGAPALAAAPLFVLAGIAALVYFLLRSRLRPAARILGAAAHAVSRVPGAVVASAGLQLAAALLCYGLFILAASSYPVGRIVRSPRVASTHTMEHRGQEEEAGGAVPVGAAAAAASPSSTTTCFDAGGAAVPCCAWRQEPWAVGVEVACAAAFVWTAMLSFCLKTYVISGAVSEWYYHQPAGGSAAPPPKSAAKTALLNALGRSFGSCACASSLPTILLRLLTWWCGLCCSAVERLGKFGVAFAAISGDSYLAATRASSRLLARNLLGAVRVFALPGGIVTAGNLALSASWGALAGAASYPACLGPAEAMMGLVAAGMPAELGAAPDDGLLRLDSPLIVGLVAVGFATAVGLYAFAFSAVALSSLTSVLLSAADAQYLCFALDKDRATVTREDVHAVMALLPAARKAAAAAAGTARQETKAASAAAGAV